MIAFVLVEARLFKCFLLEFTFLPPDFSEDFLDLGECTDIGTDNDLGEETGEDTGEDLGVPTNPNIAHIAITRYCGVLCFCSSMIRSCSTGTSVLRIFLVKYSDA